MSDEKFHYRSEEAAQNQRPLVTGASQRELALALATKQVCGECAHFSLAEGQRLMEAQRFVERLVREQDWQARHLASPLNELGICGQFQSGAPGENATITGKMHKACDAFRPARGLVSLSRKTTDPR